MPDSALMKKLAIKPDYTVLVLNAPEEYMERLPAAPKKAQGPFDFVQMFVHSKADVDSQAPAAIQALKPGGVLWFTYPKKGSGIKTDVSRDVGWDAVYGVGLRPVSLVAIDDTGSALRFRPTSDVVSRKRA